MSNPVPNVDHYAASASVYQDAAECMRFAADLLTWLRDPTTPAWVTSNRPPLVLSFLVQAEHAELALRHCRSNLLEKENAASCQNAAPRLSETTEPQAL